MYTSKKVINREKIKEVVAEKQSMTFESLEEYIAKEFLVMEENLKNEDTDINKQENKEINIYDVYLENFSILLYGLTLDELEFINDNNLFNLDKNNLLDYRCQLILNERINNFKQTLNAVEHSTSMDNIGSYFQKFGNIHEQAKQGIKLNIILGLDREDVELTPQGTKLKECIDNIKKLHIDFLKNAKKSSIFKK